MVRAIAPLLHLALLTLAGCEQQQVTDKACTPPRAYWQQPHYIGGLERPFLQVSMDHRNAIYLSGEPIDQAELAKRLTFAATIDNPAVNVFLETEMGADCKSVEALRDQIDIAMNCRESGQCAEGSRTVWKKWPILPGTPPS